MSLLVEYTVNEGKADAQVEALERFVAGLKAIDDEGYDYTVFATDDPTRFIAVFEFADDGARQRFLDSAPFIAYRDGSRDRFPHPPVTTAITLVASTRS